MPSSYQLSSFYLLTLATVNRNVCIQHPFLFLHVQTDKKNKISRCKECRSQWLRHVRRGSVAARLLGLQVRERPEAWMSVSCECCVCSQVERGICIWLITRTEESNRVLWIWVFVKPWQWGGLGSMGAVVTWGGEEKIRRMDHCSHIL